MKITPKRKLLLVDQILTSRTLKVMIIGKAVKEIKKGQSRLSRSSQSAGDLPIPLEGLVDSLRRFYS